VQCSVVDKFTNDSQETSVFFFFFFVFFFVFFFCRLEFFS